MKKLFLFTATVAILLLTGCGLLTVHPIFKLDDLVTDNRLLGKWKADGSITKFEPATKADIDEIPEKLRSHVHKFYLCTRYKSDGEQDSRFIAFLVKIGRHYYLDLYELHTEKQKKMDDFFISHDLKLHTISKIKFNNGSISWIDFKDNYVTDLVKNRQVRIKHTFINYPEPNHDKEILITASTEELQAFLLKYGDRKEAFNVEDKSNTYFKIN